jgi:hypothetical protein
LAFKGLGLIRGGKTPNPYFLSQKPMLALCYIRVNTQFVAKDQKYVGNIPIKSTPQHAIAKASTVVREGFGMTTRSSEGWKYITTTTRR